ncbi:lanthionine synthetase LanC family protein, partial [Actinophytocola xanthii]|uniref:lanthionine synthetase LanC family protein n=1 Tax=Actinophytocola xanthii TaxID=1912961 RepID=UPI000AE8405B
AGGTDEPGWCRGRAGLALAAAGHPGAPEPVDGDAPVRRDLSLCHGELGATEALTMLGDQYSRTLRRRGGLVLDVLRRHGPLCGVPGAVSTPGLLTGLAGIGYGLLRLAAPRRVPSALLLQPNPTR